MDIPNWLAWIALGVALLQVLALVPTVRRTRGPDPAVRSKARLDLLETVGTLLLLGSLLLSLMVAESWSWLGLAGLVLMAGVYAVKGIRLLRARHSA
ncbi:MULTISPECIES: hypothetical protein [unclassified Streptomyces]|uniref:hypothetical protein n=1 Tax=unclassified Streptomyces TaxID=2593676 RepID=UPI002E32CA02|nr:hypothetical protein [Streptomyces sp. NBC_01268]